MKKPTPKAIATEIQALKELLPSVRRYTAFGDDNHAAIRAEIAVIEENLDNDAIYERFQPIDDEGEPDESGNNRGELDAALGARWWLDSEKGSERPSIGWKPLVQ
jgi:hypothetical protein